MTYLKFAPPVLWLAGLGAFSGLLSNFTPEAAENFKLLGVPVYPGLLFGLVIALGVFRWGKASRWAALLAFAVTVAVWIAAMRGFLAVTDDAKTNIYLGGFVAGAIGAAGTMLGGAITLPALRRGPDWLLTVGLGALAGLLVGPEARLSGENFLLLFMVWQATVAACIAHALTRR